MKVTNLRQLIAKKLGFLIVGGSLLAGTAQADLVNINLVANPSFELASPAGWGVFTAYTYSLGYTGPAPAGAGDRYFTGGISGEPLQLHSQSIDLSSIAGDIDNGLVKYKLSAFFSTYFDQNDWSSLTVTFRDAAQQFFGTGGTVGGLAFVQSLGGGTDVRDWGQSATEGFIAAGTRSVRLDLLTQRVATGSTLDGYVDLVDFRISAVPEPSAMGLLAISAIGSAAITWLNRFCKENRWTIAQPSRSVSTRRSCDWPGRCTLNAAMMRRSTFLKQRFSPNRTT